MINATASSDAVSVSISIPFESAEITCFPPPRCAG
jgi:hypothetical protein